MRFQGLSEPLQPFSRRHQAKVPTHCSNVRVSLLYEMFRCCVCPPLVIHQDRTKLDLVYQSVHEDHGKVAGQLCGKVSVITSRRSDYHPVDTSFDKCGNRLALSLDVFIAVCENDGIPPIDRLGLNSTYDLSEKHILNIRHDETERLRMFPSETSCEPVRTIIQFPRDPEYSFTGAHSDVGLIIDNSRNSLVRHARLSGNIFERDGREGFTRGHSLQSSSRLKTGS